MGRLRSVLSLAMLCLFLMIEPAGALVYAVSAGDKTVSNASRSGDQKYYWTGAHGWNYVMKNPNLFSDTHVNSLNIDISNNYHHYEVGWGWTGPNADSRWRYTAAPRWFVYVKEDGKEVNFNSNNPPGVLFLGDATTGNDYHSSINIESNLAGAPVNFLINGQLKHSRQAKSPDGIVVWGSERNVDPGDSNYGHFWNLYKRRHDFVWVSWQTMRLKRDDDPDYRGFKLGETQAWSNIGQPTGTVVIPWW